MIFGLCVAHSVAYRQGVNDGRAVMHAHYADEIRKMRLQLKAKIQAIEDAKGVNFGDLVHITLPISGFEDEVE